ncbi:MAG: hypothetical protein WD696_20080 [Bryobacteraceae bacterium]
MVQRRVLLLLGLAAGRSAGQGPTRLRGDFNLPPDIFATDPLKVDPRRFRLEQENEKLRTIRARLGGREKSYPIALHGHLIVAISDLHIRYAMDNGEPSEHRRAGGRAEWHPGGKLVIENLSDKPCEFLIVEPK